MQVRKITVSVNAIKMPVVYSNKSLDQIEYGTLFLNISLMSILSSVYLEILKTF